MKFGINEKEKYLYRIDEDNNRVFVNNFIDKEELKNPEYTLYLYARVVDDELYVKFGEAFSETVYDRYAKITGHDAHCHMICVWKSSSHDKPIHQKLEERSKNKRGYYHISKGDVEFEILNTEEAYKIDSINGLDNIIKDITEYAKNKVVKDRVEGPFLYKKQNEVNDECISVSDDYEFFNFDLCTRWGKTIQTLELCRRFYDYKNIRIFFMCSYVGTVKVSYSKSINKYKNYEDFLFIDPDAYDSIDEMMSIVSEWLKVDSHKIMYYVALTGDKDRCFSRRTEEIKKFNINTMIFVEESDFGSTCAKQINKIKDLYMNTNCKHVIAETGTNSEKNDKLFDVLEKCKK